MTQLQPITTLQMVKTINDELVEKGGVLLMPTHTIERDGELIGAVSIGAIATVHFWFDEDKGNALQSVRAIKKTEEILKQAGIKVYQTMVPSYSPFADVMDRLGAKKAFISDLYIKTLGG